MQRSVDLIADVAARELYRAARIPLDEPRGAVEVARAIFGASCIRRVPKRSCPDNGVLALGSRRPVIYVRDGLNEWQVNHCVAHELGEWILSALGYARENAEDLARRIAAAICVPDRAFHVARENLGDDLGTLSRAFTVSESLMALRIAECLGLATALITPSRVRTRGPAWEWPSTRAGWERLLCRWRTAGLARERIRDARHRFVLRAPRASATIPHATR